MQAPSRCNQLADDDLDAATVPPHCGDDETNHPCSPTEADRLSSAVDALQSSLTAAQKMTQETVDGRSKKETMSRDPIQSKRNSTEKLAKHTASSSSGQCHEHSSRHDPASARKAIQAIARDLSLTPAEKQKKIKELMSGRPVTKDAVPSTASSESPRSQLPCVASQEPTVNVTAVSSPVDAFDQTQHRQMKGEGEVASVAGSATTAGESNITIEQSERIRGRMSIEQASDNFEDRLHRKMRGERAAAGVVSSPASAKGTSEIDPSERIRGKMSIEEASNNFEDRLHRKMRDNSATTANVEGSTTTSMVTSEIEQGDRAHGGRIPGKDFTDSLQRKIEQGNRIYGGKGKRRNSDDLPDSLQRKIEQGRRNGEKISVVRPSGNNNDSLQRKIEQGQRNRNKTEGAQAPGYCTTRNDSYERTSTNSTRSQLSQRSEDTIKSSEAAIRAVMHTNAPGGYEMSGPGASRSNSVVSTGAAEAIAMIENQSLQEENRQVTNSSNGTAETEYQSPQVEQSPPGRAPREQPSQDGSEVVEAQRTSTLQPLAPSNIKDEQRGWLGKRTTLLISLVLIAVVIAAVMPAVLLSGGDSEEQPGTPAGGKTEAPTSLPSLAPSAMRTVPPDNGIYNAILSISTEGDLSNRMSPQYKALDWIIHEDKLDLDDTSPNLVQRYALMVLYFATGGKTWQINDEQYGNKLEHECEWTLVNCTSLELPNGAGALRGRAMSIDGVVTGLGLHGLGLTGRLPPEFVELENLENLDLSDNSLSGSFPSELYDLTELRTLHLNRNNFDSSIDERIGNLFRLQELWLRESGFGGDLPAAFQNLTDMRQLELSGNDFSGPLFDKIADMHRLEIVSASFSRFDGTIPTGIGALSKLQILEVRNSYIDGSIPGKFGLLSSLVECRLAGNGLDGTIPPEIGNLTAIEILDLSANRLDGSVISELGKLENLAELRLDGNDLTGSTPDEVCALRSGSLIKLRVDCSIDGCCTECFDNVMRTCDS